MILIGAMEAKPALVLLTGASRGFGRALAVSAVELGGAGRCDEYPQRAQVVQFDLF